MTQYTLRSTRVLDQEIDTLQICPILPEYLIVGTYTLVQGLPSGDKCTNSDQHEEQAETVSATRIGSLRILPIDYDSNPADEGKPVYLCRYDIPSAILDIHFCPADPSLLGAATSTGELRFFRIVTSATDHDSQYTDMSIVPVGIADVSRDSIDAGSTALAPLITQFGWITPNRLPETIGDDEGGEAAKFLVACDTFGHIKVIRVILPMSSSQNLSQSDSNVPNLVVSIVTIHKHLYDLEAWTVSNIPSNHSNSEDNSFIVLSGGDDSCLIASEYQLQSMDIEQPLDSIEDDTTMAVSPRCIQVDKRTHTSGVVSILPILSPWTETSNTLLEEKIPILSGSYDQQLRLFLFDKQKQRLELESFLELEGGVWRIALLDTYTHPNTGQHESEKHYLLLVSAMYTGCYIIRLVCKTPNTLTQNAVWSWTIEVHFSKPHESMVYACAGKMIDTDSQQKKLWRVISTSFYDKRICVWDWTDEMLST